MRGKVFRKDLYPHFVGLGGDASTWARLLRTPLSPDQTDQMQSWQTDEWKEFITARWAELRVDEEVSLPTAPIELDLQVLETVKTALPPQPWPKGIHVEVAAKIDLNEKEVRRYIRELIRRGDFMEQVDGQLFPPGEGN